MFEISITGTDKLNAYEELIKVFLQPSEYRLITPAEAAERDAAIGRLAERYLDDIPQIRRLVMRDTD